MSRAAATAGRPPGRRAAPRRGAAWLASRWKRTIDVIVAVVALVATAPVIAAAAVVVVASLGSPVTVTQVRAGRSGRPIVIRKFRTMAESRNARGELLPDEERLGRVGRVLRASSVDELPQLVSVVRGDMSIIGPRPLPLHYVARYDARQRRRLDARPGLTGWAQVNGRNALSWGRKLELDVWYVEHASARLDLRILAMTLRALVSRRGVSAAGHATMPEFTGEH